MNDKNNDGITNEWIFTSKEGWTIDVLPTLELITMHLEKWGQMMATDDK